MKKIITILLIFVFALGLTGCGVEIADENGPDNFNLSTITKDNIINMDLGASSYSVSPSSEDEDYMTSMTKVKGKEFSGVAELYTTNYIGKSDVTVYLDNISVESGNFKVIVQLDDKIVHQFNNQEMLQQYELKDIKGTLSVKIAGETANFKCWMQIW